MPNTKRAVKIADLPSPGAPQQQAPQQGISTTTQPQSRAVKIGDLQGGGVSAGTPAVREQKDGILKTIVKEPIKTLLVKPAARTTEALGRLGVFGEEAKTGYEIIADEGKGQDLKTPFGRYQVEPQKALGQGGAKQILGEGLETASYLIPAGKVGGAVTKLGTTPIKAAATRGAIEGAKSGALFGAGEGLQADEDLAGIAKSTITGAAIGGVAGGVLGAGVAGIRHGVAGRATTQAEANQAAGRILQTKPGFEKTGAKVFQKLDTRNVKTYKELSSALESAVDRTKNEVDDEFIKASIAQKPVKLNALKTLTEVDIGGKTVKVKNNFVESALNDLDELFTTTRDAVGKAKIKALRQQATKSGLSPADVNQLAREYGTTFGSKAFTKGTATTPSTPLTSVNAVTYENTRKGLKSVARSFLDGDAAKNLDKELSQALKIKRMTDIMAEKVAKLENRIVERNIIEKAFRGVADVADVITFGGPRAFLTRMLPSNVGLKTMNALDIEKELAKNLRVIRNLENASDSALISAIRDIGTKMGIIKATTVFGRKPPTTPDIPSLLKK